MTKNSTQILLPAGNHQAWAATRASLVNVGQATLPYENSSLAKGHGNFAKKGHLS